MGHCCPRFIPLREIPAPDCPLSAGTLLHLLLRSILFPRRSLSFHTGLEDVTTPTSGRAQQQHLGNHRRF
jgi:hypothetical protein